MIVGIAGPSCSGKTTIARLLAERMEAKLLHLDAYWIKGSERPLVNGHPSFERPEQYDGAALLRSAMEASRDGDVVIEGFLLFAHAETLAACAHAFLIDVPHDELVRRRLRRGAESGDDVAASGRIEAADRSWMAHGRQEWLRYGAPQADLPGVRTIRPDVDEGRRRDSIEAALSEMKTMIEGEPA